MRGLEGRDLGAQGIVFFTGGGGWGGCRRECVYSWWHGEMVEWCRWEDGGAVGVQLFSHGAVVGVDGLSEARDAVEGDGAAAVAAVLGDNSVDVGGPVEGLAKVGVDEMEGVDGHEALD